MGKQRIVLENGVEWPAVCWKAGNVLAIEENIAFGYLGEAANETQDRGLAGPGRAEQRQELAIRHVE